MSEMRDILKNELGRKLVCQLKNGRSFNSKLIKVGEQFATFETRDGRKMINLIEDIIIVCEVELDDDY